MAASSRGARKSGQRRPVWQAAGDTWQLLEGKSTPRAALCVPVGSTTSPQGRARGGPGRSEFGVLPQLCDGSVYEGNRVDGSEEEHNARRGAADEAAGWSARIPPHTDAFPSTHAMSTPLPACCGKHNRCTLGVINPLREHS